MSFARCFTCAFCLRALAAHPAAPPAATEKLQQKGWSAFHWENPSMGWPGCLHSPCAGHCLFPKPKAACALPPSPPCSGKLQPRWGWAGSVLQWLWEVKVQQSVLQPKPSGFFLQNYGADRAKIALGHICLLPESVTLKHLRFMVVPFHVNVSYASQPSLWSCSLI